MTNLLPYARLCQSAYSGKQIGDHAIAVDTDGPAVVIAIAGTANLENVLEDVSVWPARCCGSLAHAGVVRGFRELERTIAGYIETFAPVVFAGHSLGGGIAQLFAARYQTRVITFGSLRTWFRFSRAPRLDHLRVVCDDDPVPLLPGLCYGHSQRLLVKLDDHDGDIINVTDHPIHKYIGRLERWPAEK